MNSLPLQVPTRASRVFLRHSAPSPTTGAQFLLMPVLNTSGGMVSQPILPVPTSIPVSHQPVAKTSWGAIFTAHVPLRQHSRMTTKASLLGSSTVTRFPTAVNGIRACQGTMITSFRSMAQRSGFDPIRTESASIWSATPVQLRPYRSSSGPY